MHNDQKKGGSREIELSMTDIGIQTLACSQEKTLSTFAKQYRLKPTTDPGDGTMIIQGRSGQIFQYDGRRLAVTYLSDSVGKWNNRRRECEASDMVCYQDGDAEGTLTFDPKNAAQSRLAIKTAHCRPKKQISPEHIAKLRTGLQGSTNVIPIPSTEALQEREAIPASLVTSDILEDGFQVSKGVQA
jgi:hypothetical protein